MKSLADREIGLEFEILEGQKEKVGRDPRTLTHDELRQLGHEKLSPIEAIRARCLDCSADQPSEVRRCVAVQCPSWPFRMGYDPWRKHRELTDEHKEKLAEALAKARAAKLEQRNEWK